MYAGVTACGAAGSNLRPESLARPDKHSAQHQQQFLREDDDISALHLPYMAGSAAYPGIRSDTKLLWAHVHPAAAAS